MKRTRTLLTALVFAGSLAGSALAADGVLLRDEAGGNYCHLQFPAIREDTLTWATPVLQDSTGEIIDFYGRCDENPTGPDQVAAQRREEIRRSMHEDED
jgi:hypothetical protein